MNLRGEHHVMTRWKATYILWWCKAGGQDIRRHLEEAQSRSVHFWGKNSSLAVLVVPFLPRKRPLEFAQGEEGHWRLPGEGHVIDARVLLDKDSLHALAQTHQDCLS